MGELEKLSLLVAWLKRCASLVDLRARWLYAVDYPYRNRRTLLELEEDIGQAFLIVTGVNKLP